jgi:hypothetical protein
MGTVLGDTIVLLEDFGFFEVILPFLLVFTLVFGILEKTKIFGTESYGGRELPKKNLNAMMAFVIAFFFVAAKEIVASIQESLPIVALILIAIVSFLMLVGSFASGKEELDFYALFGDGFKAPFAIVFIVAMVMIFFHSFGWLSPIYDYFSGAGNEVFIIAVFVLLTGGIMKFVFDSGSKGEE